MYGRYHKELNISDENASDPHYESKGRRMPTSSIFAQIKITDSKKAEAFVNALVVSANDPPRKPSVLVIPTVTYLDEIRKMRQRE